MLVIAFDGILFDTLNARAQAVFDALLPDLTDLTFERVHEQIAGRSLAEAVRVLSGSPANEKPSSLPTEEWSSNVAFKHSSVDETTLDIAVLRAERAYSMAVAQGVTLNVRARDMLQRVGSHTRVVLRADSRRREVERLLRLTDLESCLAMIFCSDDNVVTSPGHAQAASIHRSYRCITGRMSAHRGLLGEEPVVGVALEANPGPAAVARHWGFETAADISAVRPPFG